MRGGEALRENLANLRKAARPATLERALRAGAEVIAEEARDRVRVASGQLRDSIIVSFDALNASAVSLPAGAVVIFIGPERRQGFYGHFLEFGTVHQAPQPFMRPAFDAKRREAMAVFGRVMMGELLRSIGVGGGLRLSAAPRLAIAA